MKKLLLALVYTALTTGANPALAADVDIISPLIAGDMKKLAVHSTKKISHDSNVPLRRVHRTSANLESTLPEDAQEVSGIDSADAMLFQQMGHCHGMDAFGLRRSR